MEKITLIILFLIFGCKEKDSEAYPSSKIRINENTNCYYWIYTKDKIKYQKQDGFAHGSVAHIRWTKTNTYWRPEGLMLEYTNDFKSLFRLGIKE